MADDRKFPATETDTRNMTFDDSDGTVFFVTKRFIEKKKLDCC